MAEDKKSFVAYSDWKTQFDLLSDEEAGKLIKHIFSYVNDENPVFDKEDRLIAISFEPIKNQLKRDLKKYEAIKKKRSEAGKRSAEIRASNVNQDSTNSTSVDTCQQNSTNSTVNDNGNVTVDVNDTVNVTDTVNADKSAKSDSAENKFSSTSIQKKDSVEDRKVAFIEKITPYVGQYEKSMLNDFYAYWTEKNENGKKMRFEMEKVFDVGRRIATWAKNDKNYNNGKQATVTASQDRQERISSVKRMGEMARAIIADAINNGSSSD